MIPTPQKPPDPFALFVIAREGHVVRRFGTPNAIGYQHIADTGTPAVVDQRGRVIEPAKPTAPAQHRWDTETIHPLTADEYYAHQREYDAEIAGGGLVLSSREAWEKQREKRQAEAKKALEEIGKQGREGAEAMKDLGAGLQKIAAAGDAAAGGV